MDYVYGEPDLTEDIRKDNAKLSNRVWQLETWLISKGYEISAVEAEFVTPPNPNGRRRWRDRGGLPHPEGF